MLRANFKSDRPVYPKIIKIQQRYNFLSKNPMFTFRKTDLVGHQLLMNLEDLLLVCMFCACFFVWFSSLGDKAFSKVEFIHTFSCSVLLVSLQTDWFDFGKQSECDLWPNSTWTEDLLSITAVCQATLQYTPMFNSVYQALRYHSEDIYSDKWHLTHAKYWTLIRCQRGVFLIFKLLSIKHSVSEERQHMDYQGNIWQF